MPRFYFDVRGGSEEFHDEEGLEFPSLDDATEGAFDAARDLISEAKRAGGELELDMRYEIYDERRQLVVVVPFGALTYH